MRKFSGIAAILAAAVVAFAGTTPVDAQSTAGSGSSQPPSLIHANGSWSDTNGYQGPFSIEFWAVPDGITNATVNWRHSSCPEPYRTTATKTGEAYTSVVQTNGCGVVTLTWTFQNAQVRGNYTSTVYAPGNVQAR